MPICLLEHFAQRDKRLHISSRSNYLYNDIERRRWALSWCATEELWDVGRRWRRVLLYLRELSLDLGKDELREAAALLVNADVDSSIFCDYSVRA
jgi:hypothetical protein